VRVRARISSSYTRASEHRGHGELGDLNRTIEAIDAIIGILWLQETPSKSSSDPPCTSQDCHRVRMD